MSQIAERKNPLKTTYKIDGKVFYSPKEIADFYNKNIRTVRVWAKKRITPCGLVVVVKKEPV